MARTPRPKPAKPPKPPHGKGHTAGVVGAVVGLAAAGTAAGRRDQPDRRAPGAGRTAREGRRAGRRARRRPPAAGRPPRGGRPPGRPQRARADRRRRPAGGRGDRAAGRAADRRLRARLHAVHGVVDVPAPHPGRRAGHGQRPPPRRAAGVLRPARARRLRPRRRRALDDRAARPRPGGGARGPGPARAGGARRALDGRHDDHGPGGAAAGPVRLEGGRRGADLDVQRQPRRPQLRHARAADPRADGVLPGGRVDDAPSAGASPSAPGGWPRSSSRRSPGRCRSRPPTSTRRSGTTSTP